MSQPCILRQGIFDRWYIGHPQLRDAAWSGSRWVSCGPLCEPTGGVQVCNFATELEARDYCRDVGLEPPMEEWLKQLHEHLAAANDVPLTPVLMAHLIHEGLQIAEAEKFATAESRFEFVLKDATDEDLAEIRRHLTPFENTIVELRRK